MAKLETVANVTPTEFLASDHLVKLSGTAGEALAKGVVLKRDAEGKYVAYAGGSDVAVGISADSAVSGDQFPVLVHGFVYESKVTGVDADAKTALKGIVFVDEGSES
jgi:hypothetical protein